MNKMIGRTYVVGGHMRSTENEIWNSNEIFFPLKLMIRNISTFSGNKKKRELKCNKVDFLAALFSLKIFSHFCFCFWFWTVSGTFHFFVSRMKLRNGIKDFHNQSWFLFPFSFTGKIFILFFLKNLISVLNSVLAHTVWLFWSKKKKILPRKFSWSPEFIEKFFSLIIDWFFFCFHWNITQACIGKDYIEDS